MNNLMIDLETMGKIRMHRSFPLARCSSLQKPETSDKNSIRLLAWKVLWGKELHLTAIPSCGG